MKNLLKTAVLVAALITGGCATNKVWYNPEKSYEEAKHDLMEARYEAEKYSTGAGAGYETGVGSGVAIGLKQVKLIKMNMELKGYRLVNPSEVPPGSKVERLR